MCWRCGLNIQSGEGSSAMSANHEKHSDHPSRSMEIFIVTWLNTTIPHGDAGVCDLQTTVKRALQSTQ